ncbi:hypothetical protein [Methylorubrum thiocyanatum]|uniref:hypothetical protein n=1 Tax=Methylorubrum thiocyanatum TaxID=47958 RepID=UPI0035C7BC6C
MRRNVFTFALTLTVLWLATLVSRQFSAGVAAGAAYVAVLVLLAERQPTPTTADKGREDRAASPPSASIAGGPTE